MTTVAFLGLGRMGQPISARLVTAGFDVRAFDPVEAARSAAAAAGCIVVRSPLEAIDGAEAVVTMLPDEAAVRAVAEGEDGLIRHWQAGALWIEMTSSLPSVTRAVAAEVVAAGGEFLDAPVSGGVLGAEAGTLTVMAAGDPVALDRARPVLEALSARIVHVGDQAGAGDVAKSLNNMLSAVNLTAATEAISIALREGVDPRILVDVVSTSTGASSAMVKMGNFVLEGRPTGFTIEQYLKDLRIALEIAAADDLAPPLATATRAAWASLAEEGEGARDHAEVVSLLLSRLGLSLPDA